MNQIKYCPNCGAHVGERAVFCGNCGYKIQEETVPAEKREEKREENRRKNKVSKEAMKAAAVVLALALAAGGIAKLKVAGYLGGISEEQEISKLYYVKDGTVYGKSLGDLDGEPMRFGTDRNMRRLFDMADIWKDYARPEYYLFLFCPDLMDPRGEGQFLIDDIQENLTYSLFFKKKGEEPIQIDTGIEVHQVAKNGSIVYKKNGNLYINDLERKQKLASDISEFYLNSEKDKLLWTERTDREGIEDCYVQDMNTGDKEQVIEEGNLIDFTKDFSKICGQDSEGSFIIRDQEEREEIESTIGDLESEIFISCEAYDEKDGTKRVSVYKRGNREAWFKIPAGRDESIVNCKYSKENEKMYFEFYDEISGNGRLMSADCNAFTLYDEKSREYVDQVFTEISDGAGGYQFIFDEEEDCDDLYYAEQDGEKQRIFFNDNELLSGNYFAFHSPKDEYMWIEEDNGDLYRIKEEDAKIVFSGSKRCQPLVGGRALALENYDRETFRGDLVYYDGRESHLIETDVEEFLYWEQ